MSKLLYFRHAQASYGKADYDQLSDKGYRHLVNVTSNTFCVVCDKIYFCNEYSLL